MGTNAARKSIAWMVLASLALTSNPARAQRPFPGILPEQRTIQFRDPVQLPKYSLPESPVPSTVSNPQPDLEPVNLNLNEAIRIALDNSEVVRVLAGTTAASSGRTIYDVATTNTTIDQQNARFDPRLTFNNTFNRLENPQAIFDPVNPGQALITGIRNDNFNSVFSLNKDNALGGTLGLEVNATPSRMSPNLSVLNPLTRSSTNINYTQPLLQGGGSGPNLAPIVLARINTERSYFQFKDSVQEMVRGVVDAYWSLVAARTDVWARRRQIEQLSESVRLIKARFDRGLDSIADLAQAQTSLANLRAVLVTAEANVIQREAALRNILGIPPSDGRRLIPNSPPNSNRFIPDWDQIRELAADRRPDLIELKLILEADEQNLIIARNNAQPRLDAVALYRWNGLDGAMPNGNEIRSGSGSFTDWTMGVNFSVPLGLRQSRASLRQQELIIARDRANLHQGLHGAGHQLASSIRGLDQLYDQYLAYREARRAARINLNVQLARYEKNLTILLSVLQAISDWGNTISAEATALTQYNTLLATLERQTGTILETHGIVFYEERFGALGPLGRFCDQECYPLALRPTPNEDVYPVTAEPAEEIFDLQPPKLREKSKPVPDDDTIRKELFPGTPDDKAPTPELPLPEPSRPQLPPLPKSLPGKLEPEPPQPIPPAGTSGMTVRVPPEPADSFMDQAVRQAAFEKAQPPAIHVPTPPITEPVKPARPTSRGREIPERKSSAASRAKTWGLGFRRAN